MSKTYLINYNLVLPDLWNSSNTVSVLNVFTTVSAIKIEASSFSFRSIELITRYSLTLMLYGTKFLTEYFCNNLS